MEKPYLINTLYPPGHIVLRGSDELFFNEHVCNFYNYILNQWNPPLKKIALYLGCSHHKPFSKSFIHLKIIKMLRRHDLDILVQQFIISEPLTICPRELEKIFPAAHYDFPPRKLGDNGRKIFIERLRAFLKKYSSRYYFHVGFMPNHHKKIFIEASSELLNVQYVPYNIYYLPRLLRLLKRLKEQIWGR